MKSDTEKIMKFLLSGGTNVKLKHVPKLTFIRANVGNYIHMRGIFNKE